MNPPPTLASTTPQFHSSGTLFKSQTNSYFASRDTNISPLEAYSVLNQTQITSAAEYARNTLERTPRAMDVGCGAGVSTEVLWNLGYKEIDAIDWSGEAWNKFVITSGTPNPSVNFYESDDETFVSLQRPDTVQLRGERKEGPLDVGVPVPHQPLRAAPGAG
eukprot:CAMPEP_0118636308 /NCGR_PEP_ID=MMETSP0785-20121206/2550_1 /TAXON_ID=91992 /ORGANISM="Bolidomonas pacifica, Strain CCMP 1866" /LENGTH=161 /DNA_ID=CAMNT_0006527419 /DNA_START=345 /DNA_END=830 /DNA_ORIENTATION=+